ncbi:MAG: CsgG/HfaB family protein [Caulobacter sp.]|nr:CsgG/HfaB family protein [Caulobacter sp.]
MNALFEGTRIGRRALLAGVLAIAATRVAAAAPIRVTVAGFGASGLVSQGATEESLISLLIEILLNQGGWMIIEGEDAAGNADPPRLLRATVTKFEARSSSGLSLGGLGGGAGVGRESFDLTISLRLLDGATRQVLALATGSARTSGGSVRAGLEDDDGRTLGGERKLSPAIETACRKAIGEAVAKLSAAAGVAA